MAYVLTKSPPLAAVSIEKLMAMLERYDPFCYGYNDALNYTLTNANIFLKDGTTAKFNSNGSGLTFQQGDWEPIKIENDVLLELSFSNRTYTGEIPLYEELTNEYPNGLDPNKPDPFKNNSTTNRLLVILEEDNVDFSVAIDTGTGSYLVQTLHGMDGGKVITILKQQATGVVDLENGDLDEIRRTYSLGTYLMVPTGTTVYPDAVGSTYEYVKTDNNRYELYPIGYPYLKGKVLYKNVRWNENGTFDYVTDENDYMVGPNYNSYDLAGYIDVGSNDDELTWSMTVDDFNMERRYTMELKTLLTSKDNGNTWNVTTQQSSYDEFGSNYDPYVTTYFPKNKTRDVYLTLFNKEADMPVNPGDYSFSNIEVVDLTTFGGLKTKIEDKKILYVGGTPVDFSLSSVAKENLVYFSNDGKAYSYDSSTDDLKYEGLWVGESIVPGPGNPIEANYGISDRRFNKLKLLQDVSTVKANYQALSGSGYVDPIASTDAEINSTIDYIHYVHERIDPNFPSGYVREMKVNSVTVPMKWVVFVKQPDGNNYKSIYLGSDGNAYEITGIEQDGTAYTDPGVYIGLYLPGDVILGKKLTTYTFTDKDANDVELPFSHNGKGEQRRVKFGTLNAGDFDSFEAITALDNAIGWPGEYTTITSDTPEEPVDPNPDPDPEEPVEEKPVEFTEIKTNLLNTEFKRVTAIVNKERVVDNTDIEGQLETLTGINLVALKCRKLPTGDFNKFDWTKETSVAFEEFIAKEVFLYTYLLVLVVVNSGRGTAKRLIVESSLKPEDFKAAITNEKDCVTKYMYLEEYLTGENIAKIIKPKLTFRANPSSVTFQENVKTIELNPKVRGKIVPNDAEEVVAQLQEALTNTASDVAMIKRSDFVQFADVIDEDLNRIRIS